MTEWQFFLDSGVIPYELKRELPYFLLANAFGWTIEEIDNSDPDHIERLIILLGQLNKLEQSSGGVSNSRAFDSKGKSNFR